MEKSPVFIGIDVSKTRLDIATIPEEEEWSVEYDPRGIKALVDRLIKMEPTLIVMESTGGMEFEVAAALGAQELPFVVVNPRQVRDFAKATGRLAKTDSLDAQVLARFAEAVRPKPKPLPDQESRKLKATLTRRKQLVEMLTAERNRLGIAIPDIRPDIEDHIKWIKDRLKDLDKELSEIIRSSSCWREKDDLLRSMPGVGKVLSLTLLANLPELGSLNRREIAALVGVAPLNRDSGFFKGKRFIWGGRTKVRAALYMGALSATKHNPAIREFYLRLRESGKTGKVAITACMRKILTILNAMVKRGRPWQPNYSTAT